MRKIIYMYMYIRHVLEIHTETIDLQHSDDFCLCCFGQKILQREGWFGFTPNSAVPNLFFNHGPLTQE
jgi:hypothetical protein